MESSFNKAFERTQNPDGSIELSANSKRLGVVSTFLILALVPTSCAPAFLVLSIVDTVNKRFMDQLGPLGAIILVASVIFTFVLGYRAINNKRSSITIRPKDGLLFEGQQLPFTDVQKVGVLRNITPRGEANYVIATSHGNEIKMTGVLPNSVAEAMAEQIRADSGLSWG